MSPILGSGSTPVGTKCSLCDATDADRERSGDPRRDGVDHLDRFGETPLALLGEHQVSVEGHLEDPVASFDQLRLVAEPIFDFVRQTGGPG